MILLKNTSKEESLIIIDRIRTIVANYKFSDKDYKVTFSAGITEINKGLEIEEIINIADVALYEAKKIRNEIIVANDDKGGAVTL